jgi:hypothetical protein
MKIKFYTHEEYELGVKTYIFYELHIDCELLHTGTIRKNVLFQIIQMIFVHFCFIKVIRKDEIGT